jgi:hypothetical protein
MRGRSSPSGSWASMSELGNAHRSVPPLPFCQREGRRLKVNIMSETSFWGATGQGGHTGFLDCVDLMREHPDLEVMVNSYTACDVLHCHSWGPYYFVRGLGYRGRRVHTAHAIPFTPGKQPVRADRSGRLRATRGASRACEL